MCGIAGFIDCGHRIDNNDLSSIIQSMNDKLLHRGPDTSGYWIDREIGLALGHRRLSIIDLSPEGNQPMKSSSGRYIIVFNGEIYNYQDLRKELEVLGHQFNGNSDTEIMLSSIEQWGIEKAIKSFTGMFAFALWDRAERILYLGRDRLGEKPLYYCIMGQTVMFASELKSLKCHPHFKPEIDKDVLALYFRHNYIPSPYSIYTGVYKLNPGSILSFKPESQAYFNSPQVYWSTKSIIDSDMNKWKNFTENELIDELENLLTKAVQGQMVADVPVGAFLSGGIDSTTIVAIMQAVSSRPVKTFSIGFHEDSYNEANHAKEIANYLSTDHTELYITHEDIIDVIPRIPRIYDEPFSDPSQLPTFLVAQLARKHVTVCLSGDGGDELFGGYSRYMTAQKIWGKVGWIPCNVRKVFRSALLAGSGLVYPSSCVPISNALRKISPSRIGTIAELLASENPEALYRGLISHIKRPNMMFVNKVQEPETVFSNPTTWIKEDSFLTKMMYFDLNTYLPDDILVKVDRACMANSLESRIPLLDRNVVEFACKLPVSLKVRDEQGKWILRQVLYKYVPERLVNRPKKGFGIPIGMWLKGPLREWAEYLLDNKRIAEDGLFDVDFLSKVWQEHKTGKDDWSRLLWVVLMYQAWSRAD
ncbi:Asparagine synthetase [glutamine-hydrolyzing] 1 [Sporomusa rhizae]|uniref:asparagine synthase (glutamine-hydrolyzing) n=1 Tax=Sporomusa rhizae TaxID=357999 RepID=UPI00352AEE6B